MQSDRAFLLGLLAVVGLLGVLLVLPFLQYVLLAILLGYLLHPVQRRLAPRVGPVASAVALILLSIFAVVIPLAVVLGTVADRALALLAAVREGRVDLAVLEPVVGGDPLGELQAAVGGREPTVLLGAVVDAFGSVSSALIGLTVLLFLLYYLLKDGERFVAWVRSVTPLPARVQDRLYAALDRLMWAVLVGNVLVAAVQGVLTGVGLAAVGFPNPVFWTVVTTLLALLPLIGASIVWLPISLYLVVTGDVVAGAALFVYGAAVVSLSDNYLRPVVTGRGAGVNPGVLVVGIFGGVAALGFMGIFFGPIVLGFLRVLVEVFAREYAPADLA